MIESSGRVQTDFTDDARDDNLPYQFLPGRTLSAARGAGIAEKEDSSATNEGVGEAE
jgi:hypothetical protein